MESDTALCTDEYTGTITTGTNVKCFAFNLLSITSTVVPSTEGAGSWTWPATFGGGVDVAQLSNIQAASTAYRTVSHGIRISCTLPPTTASGFVHIAVYAPSTYNTTTWPFPTTLSQMRDLPFYRKVTLASLTQSPLTVVNKFFDATAFRYIDTTEATAGFTNASRANFHITHSWGTIFVALDGAPSASAAIGVEMILHTGDNCQAGATNNSSPAAPGNSSHGVCCAHGR